jgi:hypothetical protein
MVDENLAALDTSTAVIPSNYANPGLGFGRPRLRSSRARPRYMTTMATRACSQRHHHTPHNVEGALPGWKHTLT